MEGRIPVGQVQSGPGRRVAYVELRDRGQRVVSHPRDRSRPDNLVEIVESMHQLGPGDVSTDDLAPTLNPSVPSVDDRLVTAGFRIAEGWYTARFAPFLGVDGRLLEGVRVRLPHL